MNRSVCEKSRSGVQGKERKVKVLGGEQLWICFPFFWISSSQALFSIPPTLPLFFKS